MPTDPAPIALRLEWKPGLWQQVARLCEQSPLEYGVVGFASVGQMWGSSSQSIWRIADQDPDFHMSVVSSS